MKKYRVWRQEVVMYHNEDFDAWLMGECDRYDSWKDSYVRKDLTEVVKNDK